MSSTLRFIGIAISADNQTIAETFGASPLDVGYGCQLALTLNDDQTVSIRVEPLDRPNNAMTITPASTDTLTMTWLELNDTVAHQTAEARGPGFLRKVVGVTD